LVAKKLRVNTVVPGLVQTELWDKQGKSKEQQEKEFAEAAKRFASRLCGDTG
jgi:short-subunit dehydrogenase